MTWIIRSFVFIGRTVRLTPKSWDLGIMWWGVSLRWKCISDEKTRISCGLFWKTTAKTTPKKESVVKRNNPFATTITWRSRYREARAISLVQLRLLQGSQTKKVAHRATFFVWMRYGAEEIGASCKRGTRFRFVGAACRPRKARAGFRIPVPQPSLTNLNLLFTVGGLVRLFLFISEMNPDFCLSSVSSVA